MTNTSKKSRASWSFSTLMLKLISLMGVCFIIWFILSMLQCWTHQSDYLFYGTHYTYPNWNMFIFMSKLSKLFC